MNVIGSVPDGWWRDRTGAMRRLAAALPVPSTVVFDGRERELDAPDGVEVLWAPHADDLIASLAAPGVEVVTSDRELIGRVRAAGATVRGSREFRRSLD